MRANHKSVSRLGAATMAALLLAACDLDVSNPGVIDAATFDPLADATVVSMSAQQNFYDIPAQSGRNQTTSRGAPSSIPTSISTEPSGVHCKWQSRPMIRWWICSKTQPTPAPT
jgi:hypothetical protein